MGETAQDAVGREHTGSHCFENLTSTVQFEGRSAVRTIRVVEAGAVDGYQARSITFAALQNVPAVLQELEGEFAVRDGVIALASNQLVVLDQSVVRALREGERGEVKGVHNGQSKERGSGKMCLDMTAVVPGEHVADDESRTLAEYFKLP